MLRLLAVALFVVACTAGPAAESTTAANPTTTAPRATTTASAAHVEVKVQGCEAPPVTFSPLCEVYELLEEWHVDAPFDDDALARAAAEGVAEFVSDDHEEIPRTLICAVPSAAFTIMCDELARRLDATGLPVGPAVEAAISHMVDVDLDPFTYYVPPDQVGSFRLSGIVGGVGVLLDARDAVGSKCSRITTICRLEVVFVLDDNPGSEAGVLPGDVITAVDGDPVEGRGFTAVVSEIAGDETGVVSLTLDRDGSTLQLSIERAEVTGPSVEYGVPIDGIGYISIPDFELDIPSLVTDSLEDVTAESPGTIVVDLRDNPGGYVSALVDVVSEFVDGGVVMVSDAPDEHLEYEATPGGLATEPRLVVMVNQGTASAAEILAGALRDRRGAVIVGTNTFGKDAVQIPFTLRNGGEFHVAVARWSTPEGATVADGGLKPDVTVAWPTGATFEETIRLALEAAS